MTIITHEFADDPEVEFAAEGMMHRIILTKSFTPGYSVLTVEGVRGVDHYTATATISPEERYALARALDPEAYE